ncbi:hypothetical protein [Halobacillus litoralis]|uniref:hypothetical protein n=1 Tax=Halobacillus litoralis TaxID=45668 RepID=UPI001CFC6530|nr:hypothetical protein [Halobacillus litoralis]
MSLVLVFFLAFVLLFSFYVKIWIRIIVAAYYTVVLYLFSRGYKELISERDSYVEKNGYNPDNQKDLWALERFWDEKSAYVDHYSGLVGVPLFIFLIYSYYTWFSRVEERKHKVFILLSAIPVGFIYLICMLFFAMQGYQP